MPDHPDFDLAAAHKYFAAQCFNQAWDLIDKPERSAQEERLMVALNQASIYHWLNRPDCGAQQLSVGYWQASRIQALLKNGAEALRLGQVCLEYSASLPPFYLGYAYEALARAALLNQDPASASAHLARAKAQADLIEEAEEREILVKDLASLKQDWTLLSSGQLD